MSASILELREDGFQPPSYLVQGVKALLAALKLWMKKEVSTNDFVYFGELCLVTSMESVFC